MLRKPAPAAELLELNKVEEAKPPTQTLTVGIASEHDEGGDHAATTPFVYEYATGDGLWEFQLSGDGYTRAVSGTETNSGFADIASLVYYTYVVPNAKLAFLPMFELTLPRRGWVGSQQALWAPVRSCLESAGLKMLMG